MTTKTSRDRVRKLNRRIAIGCLGLTATLWATAQPTTRLTPVTDAMLAKPPPADWLMWRTCPKWPGAGESRYSPAIADIGRISKTQELSP